MILTMFSVWQEVLAKDVDSEVVTKIKLQINAYNVGSLNIHDLAYF